MSGADDASWADDERSALHIRRYTRTSEGQDRRGHVKNADRGVCDSSGRQTTAPPRNRRGVCAFRRDGDDNRVVSDLVGLECGQDPSDFPIDYVTRTVYVEHGEER